MRDQSLPGKRNEKAARLSALAVALCICCLAAGPGRAAGQAGDSRRARTAEAAPEFHLSAPTLLKANARGSLLTVADLNSDGLADILTVANEKSALEVYLQEGGQNPPAFKRLEVTLDQFVQGLAALDVDGDGRTDLITAGAPARLSWLRQTEENLLSSPQRLDREAEDLAAADLNGDNAPDLVLVSGRKIEVIPSGKRGLDWDAGQVFWSAFEIQGAPLILDLDGDNLPDLVFTESRRNDRLIARFQTPEGLFPDETVIETSAISDLAAVRGRKGRGDTLLALLAKTEALEQLRWTLEKRSDQREVPTAQSFGRSRTLAFDPETRGDRLVAALIPAAEGAIPCLLAASPNYPSVRIIRPSRDGSLRLDTAPSLAGIQQILAAPPAKKGDPWWIGLVSRAENTLAFCRLEDAGGRLTAPQPFPLPGAPQAAALAAFGGKEALDLAVCRAASDGSLLLEIHYDMNPRTGAADSLTTFPLKGQVGDRPSGLLAADLNGDSRQDVIALFEYADPVILLRRGETFEPLAIGEGLLQGMLAGARAGQVDVAPLGPGGEPCLLIVKDNHARALRLGENNQTLVEGQFNGRNSRSRLRAARLVRVEGPKAPPAVALLDLGAQCLSLFQRDAKSGEFALLRHVDIDDADYQTLLAADLNEDGREDLLLLAPDRLTVIFTGMADGRLETLGQARTDVEDGAYGRVAAVELLKGQGQQMLAIEKNEQILEIFLDESRDGALRRLYRFKVFNTDQVRGRRDPRFSDIQPREAAAADFNGDGKPDLVLLMHDVIGVYYQK